MGLSKIFGKLLTRIWWIYHTSSPIMNPFHNYNTEEFADIKDIKKSKLNYNKAHIKKQKNGNFNN